MITTATAVTTTTTVASENRTNMAVTQVEETNNNVNSLDSIVENQLTSLDDTDCYASTWSDLVDEYNNHGKYIAWGGRGKGGRGLARRTLQPHDIVVEDVRLEYVGGGSDNDATQLPCRLLLDNATLKLLSGRTYALLGYNGCGKSTLLRRMHAGKIPGFPQHIQSLYIPQEVLLTSSTSTSTSTTTTLDYLLQHSQELLSQKRSPTAIQEQIQALEEQLEQLDLSSEDEEQQQRVEKICDEISTLEDLLQSTTTADDDDGGPQTQTQQDETRAAAVEALEFFDMASLANTSVESLSTGQRKKLALASAVFACRNNNNDDNNANKCNLLLLDEPTNHLDVQGLIQLRQLFQLCSAASITIVFISHDVDFINHVTTDIIYFSLQSLWYYPDCHNYHAFVALRQEQQLHQTKQIMALQKKHDSMMQTLQHLKQQPKPKRGGSKKKAKTIQSHKKKMERQGIEKNEKGHRWTQQNANTGIKPGSINALDASTRKSTSLTQLRKHADKLIQAPPDRAIQFVFRNTTCTWGEPLVMALDVGHGYNGSSMNASQNSNNNNTNTPTTTDDLDTTNNNNDGGGIIKIEKRDGILFDCVDLCINEGCTYCILGENNSGKSTLLKILAKQQIKQPLEGKVVHAHGITIGYFDQNEVDNMVILGDGDNNNEGEISSSTGEDETALSYLWKRFHKIKTEQEIRGELTNFGLINPLQVDQTSIRYLSGGERTRLYLAYLMLLDPHVLMLDNPTSNMDAESVDALIYGLNHWNGTKVVVSHDANFIRSLHGTTNNNNDPKGGESTIGANDSVQCYVLMHQEGKLRRIDSSGSSIDAYLESFKKKKNNRQ